MTSNTTTDRGSPLNGQDDAAVSIVVDNSTRTDGDDDGEVVRDALEGAEDAVALKQERSSKDLVREDYGRMRVNSDVATDAFERAKLNAELRGVPVRLVNQSLRKMQRRRDYCLLCTHLAFLALYSWIVIGVLQIGATYMQVMSIEDAIFDEEFVTGADGPFFKKNFYDIYSFNEYWEWVKGPFLNAIYSDTYFNGDPYNASSQLVLPQGLSGNRVTNSIRFRTVRVRPNDASSCKEFTADEVPTYWTQDNITTCFPNFSKQSRADGTWHNFLYEYGMSKVRGIVGYGGAPFIGYGEEGYTYYLPTTRYNNSDGTVAYVNITEATELVENDLVNQFWTDQSTRVLVIDFNLVSFNLGNGLTVRSVVEVMSGGGFHVYWRMYPVVLNPLGSTYDAWRLAAQCVFLLWATINSSRQLYNLYCHQWALLYVFSSLWTVVDLGNDILSVIVVICIMYAEFSSFGPDFTRKLTGKDFVQDDYYFFDIFDSARFLSYISYLACFNLAFGCLKIFNYLKHVSRMTIMWDALRRALPDIFALAIAFLILNTAFTLIGHILFGTWTRSFHSLAQSFSTLCRSVVGDFDYAAIQAAEPNLAGLYYILVLFFQFFTLLNMFIAVVTETYSATKEAIDLDTGTAVLKFDISMSRWERRWDQFKLRITAWYFGSSWTSKCCRKSGSKSGKPPSPSDKRSASFADVTARAMMSMYGGGASTLDEKSIFRTFRNCPSNWIVDNYSPLVLRGDRSRWLNKQFRSKYKTSPYRKIWYYLIHKVCVQIKEQWKEEGRVVGVELSFAEQVSLTRQYLRSIYGNETSFTRNWNNIESAGRYKRLLNDLAIKVESNSIRVKVHDILVRGVKRTRKKQQRDLFEVFDLTWRRMSHSNRDGKLNFEDMLKILGYTEGDKECFADAKLFLRLCETLLVTESFNGQSKMAGTMHKQMSDGSLEAQNAITIAAAKDLVQAERRSLDALFHLEKKFEILSHNVADVATKVESLKAGASMLNPQYPQTGSASASMKSTGSRKRHIDSIDDHRREVLRQLSQDTHDNTLDLSDKERVNLVFSDGPLGLEIGRIGDLFVITGFEKPSDGSLYQAEKSGLLDVGDILLSVEDKVLKNMDMNQLVDWIVASGRPIKMTFVKYAPKATTKISREN